ncbi:MAG TPA: HYR domain-containing protein, partial [Candidatus Limnocylindrales bacterium]|nr:HYR domain-containing protein [Candidatus Limnocylindrales bacterium]
DYRFFFSWTPTVSPTSANDTGVFEGVKPSVTFIVDVTDGATNTAPTLNLPADTTVEGNRTGGVTAAYTVTASDAEDATAPVPQCSPANGALLPLGTNTISCSATDGGGLTTNGSFHITVVDTTAPTLHGLPADQNLVTSDPGGATLTYTAPTATDVVDASPSVGCSVPSGSTVPVGDTTVTCTATDASGNVASGSFHVHVTLAQASWDDPVGAAAGIIVNGSRTVPVKVQLLLDGQPVTTGVGRLSVVSCGGGAAVMSNDLAIQSNGRWMGHLSTDGLAVGCYQVVASVDGQAIGRFRMDVRAGSTLPSKPAKSAASG